MTYLFKNNANVNEPTFVERLTPLHIAAINNRVTIAKFLIKQGAEKKCLDADKNPIFYAINNNCWPMVEVIRNYILHEKSQDLLQSGDLNNENTNIFETHLNVPIANAAYAANDRSVTPSRIIYNFDKKRRFWNKEIVHMIAIHMRT